MPVIKKKNVNVIYISSIWQKAYIIKLKPWNFLFWISPELETPLLSDY